MKTCYVCSDIDPNETPYAPDKHHVCLVCGMSLARLIEASGGPRKTIEYPALGQTVRMQLVPTKGETKSTKDTEDPEDTLWTANDVAEYLNVSKNWVYRAAREKTISSTRLGSLVRFFKEDIIHLGKVTPFTPEDKNA